MAAHPLVLSPALMPLALGDRRAGCYDGIVLPVDHLVARSVLTPPLEGSSVSHQGTPQHTC